MTKYIYGSYLSEEEAIDAASVAELKGLKAENITIISNQSTVDELTKRTDVNVQTPTAKTDQRDPIMSKIKRIFNKDQSNDSSLYTRLIDLGLTPAIAQECVDEVNSGKVLMIADDELRMGHDQSTTGIDEAIRAENKVH